ncbi:MAG: hypothetical protein EXS16_09495 [Gemmataceae bacterium]|nr:hypothetical protein [Gemmataceae bacterium]
MKILVIEATGLSTAFIGCYGNDWVATPNLDRLAAEGVVFDWHIADQPELLRDRPWAERSIASGHHSNGPVVFSPSVVRCADLASFANDAIRAINDATECLWIEGPCLIPPWKLDADSLDSYFDEDDAEERLTPWPDPPMACATLDEAEVVTLQNTYAAVVTYFDAQLGRVLDHVKSQADMLICVTARAGLPLGEHGMVGAPRPWLHAELVHVPLVMRLPNGAEAGMRINALTQPLDLTATFLEGADAPMHGRSLWPLLRGEVPSVRPYAVSTLEIDGYECWLLRSPDWAFHLPTKFPADGELSKPRLYVKPDDRCEVNDFWQQQVDRVDEFERALREFITTLAQTDEPRYPPIDFA